MKQPRLNDFAGTALLPRSAARALERLPDPVSASLFRRYNISISRFWKSSHLGSTYFGARIRCDNRDLIQRMILMFGVWEPNMSMAFETRLTEGSTVVDIGANIGYDTLLASACVGPAGRVISIEASPAIFRELTENLHLNSAENVRTVNVAVTDSVSDVGLKAGRQQ